jgi:hypothetical protein
MRTAHRYLRSLISSAAVLGAATSAHATAARAQVVRIRVLDATNDLPVRNALITLVGDPTQAYTDSAGLAIMHLCRAGANIFLMKRLGYAPLSTTLEVPDKDTLRIRFQAEPNPAVLDEVVSNATAKAPAHVDAFEMRRAAKNGGVFVTRAEIEQNPPTQTVDLFRRIRGVQVREKDMRKVVVSSRGMVSALLAADLCIMPVGRDGLILGPNYNLNDIPVSEIYGVEVYDGPATLPAEYRGSLPNNVCGLIMIWTRSGETEARRAPAPPI